MDIYQRLRKKLRWFSVSMGLIALLAMGCANQDIDTDIEITFEQLFSNPSQYSGKNIAIEGFVFLGFETMVISEELKYSGYTEGHLVPGGRMLWIEGGIPKEVYDKLYQQQMMGPLERYGKVRLKGIFESGAEYGHLGAYTSRIVPLDAELLPWSPPVR